MRDDHLRSSCLASLDVLCAKFGTDLPYKDGLDAGFPFGGRRVPFLSYMKGIHRAAAQTGPAALSIVTSAASPYGDQETVDGVLYAYRAGAIDQPDNRALRAAFELQVPLVYFVGTRPGWYKPFYPCYVVADDPVAREVLVTKGAMEGPMDDREPVLVRGSDRATLRRTRDACPCAPRARFRGQVIPAYESQCTICRLKEIRLLDAAHIVGDADVFGEPHITNGLSLCAIHHRAFEREPSGCDP